MQHRFPLRIACRWNSRFRFLIEIDLLPRTPVAIGIVDVAAARQQFNVARAAELSPSPTGKNFGIEHVALIAAFALRARSQQKNLSQVAGGCVKSATGTLGKTGYLRCRRFQQIGKLVLPVNGENMSAVSGSREQFVVRIECQRIDDIFMRSPDARRGTIPGNAVDVGAAVRTAAGKGKRSHTGPARRRSWSHARGWQTGGFRGT